MAARQDVLSALAGGPAALAAGVLAVAAGFALVPVIGRIGSGAGAPADSRDER